jgi:hypothetical protein
MIAGRVDRGYFVAVIFSDEDAQRIADYQATLHDAQQRTGLDIEFVLVDARRPLSASNV